MDERRLCPAPGEGLSTSTVSTADVATESVPEAGTLLGLNGTVSTRQSTVLAGTGDAGIRKVVSTSRGSTADLRLLDGELRVAVTDEPTLRATATGESGGASVSWTAPAVTVSLAGEEQTLPADGTPVDFTSPDNPALHARLALGQPENVVESDGGTRASATASVLEIEVALGEGGSAATALDASLFPLSASASAPKGGVDCGAGSHNPDGDDLTNNEETSGSANDSYGNNPTDPRDADSDGDGLTDGEEANGFGERRVRQRHDQPERPRHRRRRPVRRQGDLGRGERRVRQCADRPPRP